MKIFSLHAVLALSTFLGIVACGPRAQVENERAAVTDMSVALRSQKLQQVSPLQGGLDAAPMSACERLTQLSNESKGGLRYSFFDSLSVEWKQDVNENWYQDMKGSINIAENPLTQFVLGEQVVAGSTEDFYKAAKAEHDKGNLGFMQWMVVKILRWVDGISLIQYSTIDGKLEAAFPGIFGGKHDIKDSLQYSLLKKISNPEKVAGQDGKTLPKILAAKLSLFPSSGSWDDWRDSSKDSLASALSALKKPAGTVEDQKQKTCAMVLAHQSFAQLMAIKGYNRAFWTMGEDGKPVVKPLDKSYREFTKVPVTGAFFDPTKNQSVLLDTVAIQKYDPAQLELTVSAEVPNGKVQTSAGSLGDALSMMEGLLYNFEASSPAAPWVTAESDYLFGDIQSSANKAILPGETHALSLGLMTMGFKNLGAIFIKQVNLKGALAGKNDMIAGIALASEISSGSSLVRVHLQDVIRFTRLVSYLENSLRNFKNGTPEKWARMNPVYDKKTLAALHGDALFSKAELDQLLSADEKKNILKDNLLNLKLPLAVLLLQMGDNKDGCVAEMQWDLSTGEKTPTARCDYSLRAELREAVGILAHDTQSPLLLKRASEL